MRITMTLVPLLKSKVDELFLTWLSTNETQKYLEDDLSHILHGVSPAAYEHHVPSYLNSRPASPPAPPNAVLTTRSPRSPKTQRKTSKSHCKHSDPHLASFDVTDGQRDAIPQFYFPKGTPSPSTKKEDEKILKLVENIFKINPTIPRKEFSSITKVFIVSFIWLFDV